MYKIIELCRHDFEEVFFRLNDYLTHDNLSYDECNKSAIEYISENIDVGELGEYEFEYLLFYPKMMLDAGYRIILNKSRTKLMYQGLMARDDLYYVRYEKEQYLMTSTSMETIKRLASQLGFEGTVGDNCPSDDYTEGESNGMCWGDGHYRCDSCKHFRADFKEDKDKRNDLLEGQGWIQITSS